MSSRVAYYLAAFAAVLTHNTIFPVKSQSTEQCCGNGGDSNSVAAELNVEAFRHLSNQIQIMRELLVESFQQWKNMNESFRQIKNQQDNVISTLQSVDRGVCRNKMSTSNELKVFMKFLTRRFSKRKFSKTMLYQVFNQLTGVCSRKFKVFMNYLMSRFGK